MICSRCRTEIEGGVCPQCGLESDPEKITQKSIPFKSRLGDDRQVLPGDTPDFGAEKRGSHPRVERNSPRVASPSRSGPRRPRISRSRAEPERSLFPDGFPSAGGRGEKKIVTVTRRTSSSQSLADKPLIRMPAGSRPRQVPKQQELRLESALPQSGGNGAEETSLPRDPFGDNSVPPALRNRGCVVPIDTDRFSVQLDGLFDPESQFSFDYQPRSGWRLFPGFLLTQLFFFSDQLRADSRDVPDRAPFDIRKDPGSGPDACNPVSGTAFPRCGGESGGIVRELFRSWTALSARSADPYSSRA